MWLYVVNARGSGVRRLALCGNCVSSSRVSWSSDGSRIAFVRTDGLHVVRVRTRAQRRVSTGFVLDPAWSPTGPLIAFGRGHALYTVDPRNGRVEQVVTITGVVSHPSWSPDGTKIVFDGIDQIYVVGADGSGLTLLRSGSQGSGPGAPAWSPSGDRILFFNTPGTPGAFTAEIWTMKPDGSDARRLYASPCCVGLWSPPIWSPDGKWISFSADSAGGIFVMAPEGKQRHRLSEVPTEVAWQPLP